MVALFCIEAEHNTITDMKILKFFAAVVLSAFLLPTVSAQGILPEIPVPAGGWAELSVNAGAGLEFDEVVTEGYPFGSFEVGGGLAFPLMPDIPVYARANLGLVYTTDRGIDGPSDTYSYYTSLRPSADVGYLLTIYKSIKLFLYPGIYTRFNLYGRDVYRPDSGIVRARNRMKDVDEDDRMLPLQFGFQVGAELEVERILVGMRMSSDLTHLYAGGDPTRTATVALKVGYKF
jgi:hypothetical protein